MFLIDYIYYMRSIMSLIYLKIFILSFKIAHEPIWLYFKFLTTRENVKNIFEGHIILILVQTYKKYLFPRRKKIIK